MNKDAILSLFRQAFRDNNPTKEFRPGIDDVPVSGALITPEDAAAIASVVLDGWFTEGKISQEFCKQLAHWTGTRHVSLCNSGSSANLLAVTALNHIQKGNRNEARLVITCATGFPTTVTPIYLNGLVPLFVDSSGYKTLNADVDTVLQALERKDVCGVILAHTLGFPYRSDLIRKKCNELDKWFVEDCCDALAAKVDDKYVGQFGHASTLSFFPAHHLCAGEGGGVCTNDGRLHALINSYRDWGRSCFPFNTPIITLTGSKNIQDITTSDWVLSHSGYFNVISKVFHKKYTGRIYKVKARNKHEVLVTSEHPFLVYENGELIWKQARNLSIGDVLTEAIPQWEGDERCFEWTYKTAYATRNKILPFDANLFRLIGYWLSQGSATKALKGKSGYSENKYFKYKVEFCFNENRQEIINDLCFQMREFFGVKGSSTKDVGKSLTTMFTSRQAYEFFHRFCGDRAWNKHIPYDVMGYDPAKLMHIVWGMILGDGHKSFQGYSLSSTSYEMIEQARRILLQNRILSCLVVRTKEKHKEATVNGSIISQKHDLWTLQIYGKNAEKLADLVDDEYEARSNRQVSHILNDEHLATYKIYRLSSDDVVDLDVYNLEVENDHSYHAWGIAVHNCYCAPGEQDTCNKRFDWKVESLPEKWDHKYMFDNIGYNLRMTEMQAALGLSQIQKLKSFVDTRVYNYINLRLMLNWTWTREHLYIGVEELFGISPFGLPITVISDAFTKQELVSFLESRKIRTRPVFGGNLTRQPAFRKMYYEQVGALENSDYIMDRTFWVGCHPALKPEQLNYVAESFRDFFREKGLN